MGNDSFVNEFRSGKDQENLKKRMAGASKVEIEEYIVKLQKQVKDTEFVFQERHEDLRGSLLAMTRERDELLRDIKDNNGHGETDAPIEQMSKIVSAPNPDLEQMLGDRGLVAMPKEVFVRLKDFDAKNGEKLEQIEYALGQTKMQYQKLLVQHQMTQEENQQLAEEKNLLEGAAFQIQKSSQNERDMIISHYQSIQESQHIAMTKLREILATTTQMMDSMLNADDASNLGSLHKKSG